MWRPKLPQISAPAVADQKHTIQILDLHNKIICHEFPLGRDVTDGQAVFVCGDDASGSVFAVTSTRKVWRFAEKDIETKLDELVKRNLYSTGIALARANGCDANVISSLYQRYGDHLYEKGNFEDAVAQYIRTIGHVRLSPS